ncbi:MAG: hypothetical protein ACFFDM_12070 [Candidatus Thorarchaeota archaeon]
MKEDAFDKVRWKGTLLKMGILLIFPTYIGLQLGEFIWSSLSFTVIMSTTYLNRIGPLEWSVSLYSMIFSVFLMLPAVYFERRIKSAPIESSIKRTAVASTVGTWLLSFGSSYLIFEPIVVPAIVDPWLYFEIMDDAINFVPTLAITIFIIWPLLKRELVIRNVPLKMRGHSFDYLSRITKDNLGRTRFIPLILWFGLLFSPIMNYNSWSWNFISPLYVTSMYDWTLIGIERIAFFPFSILILNMIPMYILPFCALIFSIRYLFVRDIYRFKERKVPKSRLISVGLLAEIIPIAVLTGMGFFSMGLDQILLPNPLFPLLGFLYIWLDKSPPLLDEIWEDEEHRMWFEGEKPIQPPLERGIKVPISYMIISQFRRLRKH